MEYIEQIRQYVYLEYMFAICLVTDVIRYLVPKIDKKTRPKFLVLIVSIVLSIPGYIIHQGGFEFFKALISFALAIVGYDYMWKPFKEKYLPTVDEKQKE